MPHDYAETQLDFYDGIDEIFEELFSDRVFLHMMDIEAQEPELGLYREAAMDSGKKYLTPVALVGSVIESHETGDGIPPEQAGDVRVAIRVPAKQLAKNAIPHLAEADRDRLKMAKFSFHAMDLILIDEVIPRVMVADMFHLYEFLCHVPKKQEMSAA
jgi:hypothetical protein